MIDLSVMAASIGLVIGALKARGYQCSYCEGHNVKVDKISNHEKRIECLNCKITYSVKHKLHPENLSRYRAMDN